MMSYIISYIANETESHGRIALHNHEHRLGPWIDLLQNHVQLAQWVPPHNLQCLHQRGNACMKGGLRTAYILYDILYDITKIVNIIHDIIYIICDITYDIMYFYDIILFSCDIIYDIIYDILCDMVLPPNIACCFLVQRKSS